jgi:hypothetical protein
MQQAQTRNKKIAMALGWRTNNPCAKKEEENE